MKLIFQKPFSLCYPEHSHLWDLVFYLLFEGLDVSLDTCELCHQKTSFVAVCYVVVAEGADSVVGLLGLGGGVFLTKLCHL